MSNTVNAQPEQNDEEPTTRNAWVKFHGREIEVKPPTPEQIAAIMSFAREYDDLGQQGAAAITAEDAADAVDALAESLDVATCLCAQAADRRFVRRACLSGKIQLADTTSLIVTAFQQLTAANPHLKLKLDGGGSAPAALVTS